ncbi:hypothetical protein NQ314_001091 [Rhamnusium bicolor]|uniref:DDE Tnp4 domain-containing protein n=1 Tax=Rhamnusium bicolor TaxID=1586634 RepID=A0AAV8ZVC8_9CUCU|nr:hypothetical protein NQ314_001091 [Rhamnusium bicolor]
MLKCNFVFTLQATCDAKLNFIDCYVGYPGSVSDTRIFRNSDLYENVSQNKNRFFPDENLFIIGDKAYPLLDWCIPPYIDRGNLNAAKRNFNLRISQTRQVIQGAFALLFGRFRRLKYLDMNRIDFIPPVILASSVFYIIYVYLTMIYKLMNMLLRVGKMLLVMIIYKILIELMKIFEMGIIKEKISVEIYEIAE